MHSAEGVSLHALVGITQQKSNKYFQFALLCFVCIILVTTRIEMVHDENCGTPK